MDRLNFTHKNMHDCFKPNIFLYLFDMQLFSLQKYKINNSEVYAILIGKQKQKRIKYNKKIKLLISNGIPQEQCFRKL